MARKKKEENIEVTTATEEAKEAGVTADGAPEESAEAAAAEEAPKLEFKKPSKAERPHGYPKEQRGASLHGTSKRRHGVDTIRKGA